LSLRPEARINAHWLWLVEAEAYEPILRGASDFIKYRRLKKGLGV
jgi:hypothetical protein